MQNRELRYWQISQFAIQCGYSGENRADNCARVWQTVTPVLPHPHQQEAKQRQRQEQVAIAVPAAVPARRAPLIQKQQHQTEQQQFLLPQSVPEREMQETRQCRAGHIRRGGAEGGMFSPAESPARSERSDSDTGSSGCIGSSGAGGISRAGSVLSVGSPSKRGRAPSGAGAAGKALPL